MKIYTKKGDTGETGLYGGERVPKDHLRIETYGTLDELNAVMGIILSHPIPDSTLKATFSRIQSELFQLGAELATPRGKTVTTALLGDVEITALESEIDAMEGKLSPLKTFILPGGSLVASQIHLARTVSRRAERAMVTLNRSEPVRAEALQYMNRLSDYLFVCARFANLLMGVEDVPWHPPKN